MPIDVEQLYRKYSPMVLRRCRALLSDEDAALDAMQETFVQLLRRQSTLTDEAPSSMLYTFATNICLNQLRSQRRRPLMADPELIDICPSADDPAERALDGHFLDRLLRNEDAGTGRMLRLHFVEKRTLKETADMVQFSVAGVRQRLGRLRERALVLREL